MTGFPTAAAHEARAVLATSSQFQWTQTPGVLARPLILAYKLSLFLPASKLAKADRHRRRRVSLLAMVGAPFARLLANLVVMGTGVLGRAIVEAYKQALQSAHRQSAP